MTENSLPVLLMTVHDTDEFSWREHSWTKIGAVTRATLRPFKNPALRSVQNLPALAPRSCPSLAPLRSHALPCKNTYAHTQPTL